MKLWLLSTDDFTYDNHDAFVVRAETEAEARTLAHAAAMLNYIGQTAFADPEKSTCVQVTTEGSAEIILSSFNAG